MAKRTAYTGLLVAVAFLLSYIESLLPLSLGIPGVKLGLANLAVFAALYITSTKNAFFVSVARIVLVSLTFGNTFSLIYSIAGGMLSLLLMVFCKKSKAFSKVGVSIVGGVSHNIAQIAVAICVLETPELIWYLPALLISGTVAGAIIGLVGALILERFMKNSDYLF